MKESFIVELNVSAPLFNLPDIYDRAIDLKQYQGKKVFIGFFRHVGCPFCNLRVHNLLKKYEEYKSRNMEMIFFFESKKEVILRSLYHSQISPIPIIADPEKICSFWDPEVGLIGTTTAACQCHVHVW